MNRQLAERYIDSLKTNRSIFTENRLVNRVNGIDKLSKLRGLKKWREREGVGWGGGGGIVKQISTQTNCDGKSTKTNVS